MRTLLWLMALLTMSLASGVAMARFALSGTVAAENGLTMPHPATRSYIELCGSCARTTDTPSADPA